MLSKLTFNGIWWSYLFLDKKKKKLWNVYQRT